MLQAIYIQMLIPKEEIKITKEMIEKSRKEVS